MFRAPKMWWRRSNLLAQVSSSVHHRDVIESATSGCGSQPFGGDLGQKSMEIVAGEGPGFS